MTFRSEPPVNWFPLPTSANLVAWLWIEHLRYTCITPTSLKLVFLIRCFVIKIMPRKARIDYNKDYGVTRAGVIVKKRKRRTRKKFWIVGYLAPPWTLTTIPRFGSSPTVQSTWLEEQRRKLPCYTLFHLSVLDKSTSRQAISLICAPIATVLIQPTSVRSLLRKITPEKTVEAVVFLGHAILMVVTTNPSASFPLP